MEQSIIFALDFDGVICDSAIETGISAWKAATQIWSDMKTASPDQKTINQFRRVRPVLETGYESILIIRMLFEGKDSNSILNNFANLKKLMIAKSNHSEATLKKLFGETRDQWINESLDHWIEMNPLFEGIKEKLIRISRQQPWYIVTTKQERFVAKILQANQIELPQENIFGMERYLSKENILIDLQHKHPEQTLYFVEDRLPPLLEVIQNKQLGHTKPFFATWGYNTRKDKIKAAQYPIELLTLDNFLN